MTVDAFRSTIRVGRLSGPFGVDLRISGDQVELAPRGVLSRFLFKPTRAVRDEVIGVNKDTRWRHGIRIRTTTEVFDRFAVIPDSAKQRDAIHAAFERHGYPVA